MDVTKLKTREDEIAELIEKLTAKFIDETNLTDEQLVLLSQIIVLHKKEVLLHGSLPWWMEPPFGKLKSNWPFKKCDSPADYAEMERIDGEMEKVRADFRAKMADSLSKSKDMLLHS